MRIKKGILILSPSFSPNIGGVETHLDDLTSELDKKNYAVYVHTYSPITTLGIKWKHYEKKGKNIYIWRYFLPGFNIFHLVENYPLLDFLYLTPYLLFRTMIWMVKNQRKIDVVHSQGFNAALIALILKIFFNKRLITSTHAVYNFYPQTYTAKMVKFILNCSDLVLCLSNASLNELRKIGVKREKLRRYQYWVNIVLFKPKTIVAFKKQPLDFQVLFVGRLIKKKGVRLLCKAAQKLPKCHFTFVGTGPEEKFLNKFSQLYENISLITNIPNNQLPKYYNQADLLCMPSLYPEGFGRVAMEALACGLPVLAANKGGLREFITPTVGELIKPTVASFVQSINKYYLGRRKLDLLKKNCRLFAVKNFAKNNVKFIIQAYG